MSETLTAELDRIAEQVAGAQEAFMPMGTTEYASNVQLWHAPRLLAAVRAALKHHQPRETRLGTTVCRLDGRSWPCPEVAAITREITGKGESDE